MFDQTDHRVSVVAACTVALTTFLCFAFAASVSAAPKSNQIRYEYVLPKNPEHKAIHDHMKQGRTLELLQQLLSPIRLPHPLLFKVAGCDGVKNAWYDNEVITVCYELLANFVNNAPDKDLPIGISRADTIIGAALDVFLHETGHAVFHMIGIPVLGREEDAADQFSAYVALKLPKEDARRMILGSAYQYRRSMPDPDATLPITEFANEHSLPAQRMFNVLCIAYGADQKLFDDIVEKGFLPRQRAKSCLYEYDDLSFAMTKLIAPHFDKRLAKKAHEAWARTVSVRQARLVKP
jgi:hypothetical protein